MYDELLEEYLDWIDELCNSDYQYQGEEGLLKAYEDFPFEEWVKERNNNG